MTDVKRLLEAATPLPWIRPWLSLEVHAPGEDDLFGRLLLPGSLESFQRRAQRNIDLAVAAVNRLPDYEAAVDALERVVEATAAWHLPTTVGAPKLSDALIQAREVLARLREAVAS